MQAVSSSHTSIAVRHAGLAECVCFFSFIKSRLQQVTYVLIDTKEICR